MARTHDDPERGLAINSATDPQRPGEPVGRPRPDTSAPGATAQETSVPLPHVPATPAPRGDVERPAAGPESAGGDVERG